LAPCWRDVVAVGGATEPGGGTAVGTVVSLLTSPCFRKRAESRRRLGLYIPRRGSGDGSLLRFLPLPLGFRNPRNFSQRRGKRPFLPPCAATLSVLVMADRVTIISPRDPWPFSTVTASSRENAKAPFGSKIFDAEKYTQFRRGGVSLFSPRGRVGLCRGEANPSLTTDTYV
jgi:hypothetical protein